MREERTGRLRNSVESTPGRAPERSAADLILDDVEAELASLERELERSGPMTLRPPKKFARDEGLIASTLHALSPGWETSRRRGLAAARDLRAGCSRVLVACDLADAALALGAGLSSVEDAREELVVAWNPMMPAARLLAQELEARAEDRRAPLEPPPPLECEADSPPGLWDRGPDPSDIADGGASAWRVGFVFVLLVASLAGLVTSLWLASERAQTTAELERATFALEVVQQELERLTRGQSE